jgi:hypothetical protein
VTYGPCHRNVEGPLVRNHTIYVSGGECLQPLASIVEIGEYEVHNSSTATTVCNRALMLWWWSSLQGAFNYDQQVEQLLITLFSLSFVTLFNEKCSCGGSWELDVERDIIGCQTCDIDFLSSSDVSGERTYGNILAYPESIRFV